MMALGQAWGDAGAWGAVALAAIACAAFVVFGSLLALSDARTLLLPDRWVMALSVGVLPALVLASLWAGEPGRAKRVLLAAACVGGAFLALHLASPRSLGFGDVKLVPALAGLCAFVSWGHLAAAGVLACAVAAVFAIVVMLRRRSTRAHLALGPALVVGGAVVLVL